MAQRSLVSDEIDAGLELIDWLDEHFPVRAAFWLKTSGEGRWYLFIALDVVNGKAKGVPYEAIVQGTRELSNPHLDPFQVKLIWSDDPLAQAALDAQRRLVGRVPTYLNECQFGGMPVEEGYLYPPPPYGPDAKVWRGISVNVWPEPAPEGGYRVEFWPRQLAAMILPGGKPKRVSRPAGVLVREGQVVGYRPPERAMPHLTQSDYEKKALEAVEQVATSPD